MAKDRTASEEKVLEAMRKSLPRLRSPVEEIHIRLVNPDQDPWAHDDAVFTVTYSHASLCRRGS